MFTFFLEVRWLLRCKRHAITPYLQHSWTQGYYYRDGVVPCQTTCHPSRTSHLAQWLHEVHPLYQDVKKFASATDRGAWSARHARKARHGRTGFSHLVSILPSVSRVSCGDPTRSCPVIPESRTIGFQAGRHCCSTSPDKAQRDVVLTHW